MVLSDKEIGLRGSSEQMNLAGFAGLYPEPLLQSEWFEVNANTAKPFAVNQDENGAFLGNVNYSPYQPCH